MSANSDLPGRGLHRRRTLLRRDSRHGGKPWRRSWTLAVTAALAAAGLITAAMALVAPTTGRAAVTGQQAVTDGMVQATPTPTQTTKPRPKRGLWVGTATIRLGSSTKPYYAETVCRYAPNPGKPPPGWIAPQYWYYKIEIKGANGKVVKNGTIKSPKTNSLSFNPGITLPPGSYTMQCSMLLSSDGTTPFAVSKVVPFVMQKNGRPKLAPPPPQPKPTPSPTPKRSPTPTPTTSSTSPTS
jgi:hypothetical protein